MGSETCKPQKGELGGRAQDGLRRPKTPGPIISHFGSGSSTIMAKAGQALLLFTKRELEDYETLKTKREKLSSCCKELRKLSRRIIGGSKGTSADTLEAKEILKKVLKTDITRLKKRVKTAFGKAYFKIRKTQKEKGCLLRSRREPGLQ